MKPAQSADETFSRILFWVLIAVPAIAAVFAVIGYLAEGQSGLISGIIGAALALLYSGLTVLSVIVAGRVGITGFYATILGFWLAKVVLFLVILLLLRGQPFIVPWVLVVSLVVAAVFTLIVDVLVVLRSRVPVTDLVEAVPDAPAEVAPEAPTPALDADGTPGEGRA